MEEQVKTALSEITQGLAQDGGGVEFVGIEEKTVKVKLTGACAGCPMAQATLKNYVEKKLIESVPEVESVEAV